MKIKISITLNHLKKFFKEPNKERLIKLNNFFMTINIGSMTKQFRIITDSIAADEILRFYRNKKEKF